MSRLSMTLGSKVRLSNGEQSVIVWACPAVVEFGGLVRGRFVIWNRFGTAIKAGDANVVGII